jgi:hypothetical protein
MELLDFKKIKFFVEGLDKIFIKDFIKIVFSSISFSKNDLDNIVFDIGGYTHLPKYVPKFLENQNQGIKNIIIFDADYKEDMEPNNGFQNKSQFIEKIMMDNHLSLTYFLLPNNRDDGDLESLLSRSINPKNQLLLDCWDNLENCIKENNENNMFKIPSNKSKIYFYLECLRGNLSLHNKNSKVRDADRDFIEEGVDSNDKKWNIDIEGNSELIKLKDFLINNCKP